MSGTHTLTLVEVPFLGYPSLVREESARRATLDAPATTYVTGKQSNRPTTGSC